MENRIVKLNIILSLWLFFIPLVLILATGEIRSSISNYAYSSMDYLFTCLLTIAGMMFIFNGTTYNSRQYNIILGVSLILVAITPHYEFPIIHYTSAVLFYLGSVLTMVIFSSKEQRPIKIYLGLIVTLALLMHFTLNLYSLFWAEWIGMFPICLHYLGETTGKLD